MMRFAICEDEKEISVGLSKSVKEHMKALGDECIVDVFSCGSDFEKSAYEYDLVFLDCVLPDTNGLDVAKRLRERGCRTTIIFVTAYEEYVYESFKVNTFRYLLKPIEEKELRLALTSFMLGREKENYIEFPVRNKTVWLGLNEIVYIESCDKHSIVRALDDIYETTKTISDFQSEINSFSFFRTHRRFLVNMKYITEIDKNVITLTNSERVEISRRNITNFNKCYMNYLKYSV